MPHNCNGRQKGHLEQVRLPAISAPVPLGNAGKQAGGKAEAEACVEMW